MKFLKKYSINKNIFGYEKYKKNSTIIEKNLISKIYNDNIFQTKIKFDIIISFFVLEHILSTEEYFNKIKRLLTNNGILFLQVPDIENNPYDFIIYDHVFHFSKSSLINLLKKNNFRILKISNNVIKGEITCIVKKKISHKLNNTNFFLPVKKIIEKSYKFLDSNIKLCKKIIENNNKFLIFGSSISGNWIFNYFKSNIKSFIDEDKNRVGQKINKLKILDLSNSNLINYPIFIPLIAKIAKKIEKRYPNHQFHYIKK